MRSWREKTVKWEKHSWKQQVLTHKGAASRSARHSLLQPWVVPHNRCCLGGAQWAQGADVATAGQRWGSSRCQVAPKSLENSVWPDQQRSYQFDIRHTSVMKKKKMVQITSEQQALKWFTTSLFSRGSIFLGTVLLKYLTVQSLCFTGSNIAYYL